MGLLSFAVVWLIVLCIFEVCRLESGGGNVTLDEKRKTREKRDWGWGMDCMESGTNCILIIGGVCGTERMRVILGNTT